MVNNLEKNKLHPSMWQGKKVLVTGHTGFKGSWLCIWLLKLGAEVIGYSLEPHSEQDNFAVTHLSEKMTDIRGDIRDLGHLQQVFDKYQPEVVFHLAAQPLVLESYANPRDTYEINVMGTLNVLEAIQHTESVREAVMITTDKCYENKETLEGYRETDPFGGYDPYSSSKACDEILISSYRRSFMNPEKYEEHHKAIASVRAGNVIGGGDWADNRIIPDCIRAIEAGEPIRIRNRKSVRPWQHVLEPLSGYLQLAEHLMTDPIRFAEGWNFGPKEDGVWNVWDVAEKLIESYGTGELVDASVPGAVHEATLLRLNIEKAMTILQWKPKLSVEQAVSWTAEWYKVRKEISPYDICMNQIKAYEIM